jgi:phosphate transport system ATP-binding protein
VETLMERRGPGLEVRDLSVRYGALPVLHDISLEWGAHQVGAIIGPSGCGKTTLLRALNRLTETTPSAQVSGQVLLAGGNVNDLTGTALRRRVGMVFQRPNPFAMSIFDNVAYALRPQGSRRPGRRALADSVERALVRAGLWEEVKHRLNRSALRLSGGQQQRLCIARALAAEPEVILMDEPCSSLDPAATAAIENLIGQLRLQLIVVVVTHDLAQARRVSDQVAFLLDGRLVESGDTKHVFERPCEEMTAAYLAGAFG